MSVRTTHPSQGDHVPLPGDPPVDQMAEALRVRDRGLFVTLLAVGLGVAIVCLTLMRLGYDAGVREGVASKACAEVSRPTGQIP